MSNSSKNPWGNSLNLMWCVDKDFNFISSNHTLNTLIENITGKAILKGNNIQHLNYTLLPVDRFKSNCEKALKGAITKEIVYIAGPYELWMEIAYHPIYKYNDIICCACYFHDVTSRPISTNEIAQIKTQLSQQMLTLTDLLQAAENKKIQAIEEDIKLQLGVVNLGVH